MATNRQVVSDVINDLRALQFDDYISERYVLSKLKAQNALFLKRENEQLRLYDDNNVWFTIGCLVMEPVDAAQCGGVQVPQKVPYVRSKESIPDIYSSAIGPLIRELYSIDGSRFYQPTTPKEYRDISRRQYKDKNQGYFWFDGDRRLVIPDSDTRVVSFTFSPVEPWKAQMADSCEQITCPEPMDDPFLCPSHLLATVKQETTKELMEFYKRVIPDEVPDLDNNTKTEKHA